MSEDGFYVLTIARNIARGAGVTIDGVTPTNGFQPLYAFAIVPAFWAAGDDALLPLRMISVLHWVTFVGTAWLLAAIAARLAPAEERRLTATATVLAYLASRQVLQSHFNGLETGLLLFLIALVWHGYQRHGVDSNRRAVAFGALLGLVMLARIDQAMLLVAVCAVLLARGIGWRRVALASATALAVVSPWLIYGLLSFGSLVPSSGAAQQDWTPSGQRLLYGVMALAQAAAPLVSGGALEGWALHAGRAALVGLAVVLVWRHAARLRARWTAPSARRSADMAIAVAASAVLLAGWYTASSWAAHFYVRYVAGLMLVGSVALGLAAGRLGRAYPRAAVVAASVLILHVTVYVAALHAGVYLGRLLPSRADWSKPIFIEQLDLVRAHVPSADVVGAGQSGTLGYFRPRVVNLDGKVNAEALAYQERMVEYLERREIRWVCDMPSYTDRYFQASPERSGWHLHAQSRLFRLYRRAAESPRAEAAR